jgi:drug/metabolite transporter (DMT)-like permease
MALGSLLLGGISLVASGWPPSLGIRDLAMCAVTGILMWVMGNGLATMSSPHAASAFIVMVMGMIPVWTVLVTSLVDRTVPSRSVLFGLALGVAGLGLIFAPSIFGSGAGAVEYGYGPWVALMLSAAGLSWSVGSILQRPILRKLEPSWAASLQMLTAALVLASMSALEGNALVPDFHFSTAQISAFGYTVIFGSAICLISYLKVLDAFSPAVASTFAYVNPMIGIILGWTVLGERPGLFAILGIALILAGVFLVMSRGKSGKRVEQFTGARKPATE